MSFPYIGICHPVETAGVLSLSLSYALSQTHDLSMGHCAVVSMRLGCWVAVNGWEGMDKALTSVTIVGECNIGA